MWKEGSAEQQFDVTQYLVAEQPIKLPDGTEDPNAQNQSGTGTSSGTRTGSNTSTQPGLFPGFTAPSLLGKQKGN
jgi:hypothetical protein